MNYLGEKRRIWRDERAFVLPKQTVNAHFAAAGFAKPSSSLTISSGLALWQATAAEQ